MKLKFWENSDVAQVVERACKKVEAALVKEKQRALAEQSLLFKQEMELLVAEKDAEIASLQRTNQQYREYVLHSNELRIKAADMVRHSRRYAVDMTTKSEMALNIVANIHQEMLRIKNEATTYEKEVMSDIEEDKKQIKG